jgi:ATP-dependent exoDNAse (exonuclease V) beta subunit
MASNSEKLHIDKEKYSTISYSQYSLYNKCQYRWYLDYVKKLKKPEHTIDLTFGTSFHECFQNYLEVLYTKSEKEANKIDFSDDLTKRMCENYAKNVQELNGTHYTTKEIFQDYINDGVTILEWIRKRRSAYFRLKGYSLVGIEVPLQIPVSEERPNVLMVGFIDLVLKNDQTGKYYVLDIKTSRQGWREYDKKDQVKVNQVLFYKKFYSQILNVSEDMVEVSFFIVRRKLYENSDFPIKRVQEFVPTQGKIKIKQAIEGLNSFVNEAFTIEGKPVEREYPKNTDGCKYCPYAKRPDLCSKK